jgi:hypothetical protein
MDMFSNIRDFYINGTFCDVNIYGADQNVDDVVKCHAVILSSALPALSSLMKLNSYSNDVEIDLIFSYLKNSEVKEIIDDIYDALVGDIIDVQTENWPLKLGLEDLSIKKTTRKRSLFQESSRRKAGSKSSKKRRSKNEALEFIQDSPLKTSRLLTIHNAKLNRGFSSLKELQDVIEGKKKDIDGVEILVTTDDFYLNQDKYPIPTLAQIEENINQSSTYTPIIPETSISTMLAIGNHNGENICSVIACKGIDQDTNVGKMLEVIKHISGFNLGQILTCPRHHHHHHNHQPLHSGLNQKQKVQQFKERKNSKNIF